MPLVTWLIIVACLGYLAAIAGLFLVQRSFIYPIPQAARTLPVAAGFPEAEEHVLATADGEGIIAWYVPAKPDHHVVLYFPGNGDVLAGLIGRFREITSDGTGLIAVSYRGYAGSSGSPSEAGLLQDAAAAYNFALARYATRRIVLWGFSLGSGVAVALASNHSIGGLILEAPYTSLADVAATLFRWVPIRYLLKDRFRSDVRIVQVNAPLLVMHGDRDLTISISFGERLLALAHEPKQFVHFPRGGHNDLDQFGAIETARKFIAELPT
jgi:fermentation-respiration switch protein FrsA (DUF1100 family)